MTKARTKPRLELVQDGAQRPAKAWAGRWDHGRLRLKADGRVEYYIEAQRNGRPYLRPTGVFVPHDTEAEAEFSRFEDDPPGYRSKVERRRNPTGGPPPIPLDADLVQEFLDWNRDRLKLTKAWLAKKKRYLAWWMEKLYKQDLRGLDKRTILAAAPDGEDRAGKPLIPSRPHKIAVLKSLYEYLRNPAQRLAYKPDALTLTAAEDPMIDFSVPQRDPAQSRGKKAPIPLGHLQVVLGALSGTHRDALLMLAGTGWRGTEIPRFAVEGKYDEASAEERAEGIVCTIGVFSIKRTQKKWKKVQIRDERVKAAALRLRDHGSFDLPRLDKAIRHACKKAKIKPFGYGSVRHTVAGYAKTKRERTDIIAQAIGNTPDVLMRDYQQMSPAPPIPTPLAEIALKDKE